MNEKQLKRLLGERLTEIQSLLVARRIDGEEARDQVAHAQGDYRRRLARLRARPRRRRQVVGVAATLLAVAGLAWLVVRAGAAQAGSIDRPWLAAIAAVGGLAPAIWLAFENARIRGRVRTLLGAERGARFLDAPLSDLACDERDVAVLVIEVKNLRALIATMDDEGLADLDSAVLDFVAARVAARSGQLAPRGRGVYLAVFDRHGEESVSDAALAALALQGDLARTGNDIGLKGRNVHLGIGLNAGRAQAGLVGTGAQQELVCLGRTVELAHELAEAATWGEVLVPEELAARLTGTAGVRPRDPMRSGVLDSIVRILSVEVPLAGEPAQA
jgi:class 3 adenylate cyclase